MSLMDMLRKVTQPYDDNEADGGDFFEDAAIDAPEHEEPSAAQRSFESSFGGETPARAESVEESRPARSSEGGLFGAFGRKGAKAQPERTVNFNGKDQRVVLFNPKNFNEAGTLVKFLEDERPVVMTLEGIEQSYARRLLDFLSGIIFAMKCDITPISAKTYFVSPKSVGVYDPSKAPEKPVAEEEH